VFTSGANRTGNSTEPNVVIAALLRDANQDQGVTAETIAIEEKCREAKPIKLADKVNLRAAVAVAGIRGTSPWLVQRF
jgi:hypothetical protein